MKIIISFVFLISLKSQSQSYILDSLERTLRTKEQAIAEIIDTTIRIRFNQNSDDTISYPQQIKLYLNTNNQIFRVDKLSDSTGRIVRLLFEETRFISTLWIDENGDINESRAPYGTRSFRPHWQFFLNVVKMFNLSVVFLESKISL